MGREATTPSIIRKIEKVQGGEQAPQNGSLALPKDTAVKPFSLKGKLNVILIVLSPILARRSNDWSKTLLREYWPSKCLRHLLDHR
jgi:hypothetical protein